MSQPRPGSVDRGFTSLMALIAGIRAGVTPPVLPTPSTIGGAPRRKKRKQRRAAYTGKLNFRRSDTRHPMYDALRERGWEVVRDAPELDELLQGAPCAVRRNKQGAIVDVKPPAIVFEIEHDRDRSIRIPKCLRGAT